MAFNPLYAAGPGRPVNLQRHLDPSIVGQGLQATPVATSPADLPKSPGAPTTTPFQPTQMDRVHGAVASFGANTDPNSVYAPEQFLGSAARGFAGVKNYLAALAGQHAASQRQAQQDELERRNIESQIADRNRLQASATTAEYITDPTDANYELQIDRDKQGNRVWARDPEGRPIRRSKREVREAQETWQREGYTSFEAWREDKLAGRELPSEGERRAAGLLTGARQAMSDVEEVLVRGFSPNAEPALSQIAGVLFNNSTWRNALASPDGQRYYSAVERIFNNYLYTVSGAQVPPSEIANQARQKTVAFFDSPASREQKLRYLRGSLAEMEVMAGRALSDGAGGATTPPPGYTPPPPPSGR